MRDIEIEDRLCSFIKDFGDDLYSLELLLFFSRHPSARFNRTAVLHAVTARRFDTSIALKSLVDRNLVFTITQNGVTLYSLTKEEPLRSLAVSLVSIDQRQWQKIVVQLINSREII